MSTVDVDALRATRGHRAPPTLRSSWHRFGALIACGLAACAGSRPPVFEREAFGSTGTYTRAYAAPMSRTCEAARRALLSQGYVIDSAGASEVKGRKSFQPEAETHIEIAFSVVCAADAPAGGSGSGGGSGVRTHGEAATTIAFANAVQDRYALKKSNNSASVGLSVLGSVSLPFTSSNDSMVKVASETIGADDFYDRFFGLIERYLAPGASAPSDLALTPAPPSTPAASSTATATATEMPPASPVSPISPSRAASGSIEPKSAPASAPAASVAASAASDAS